MLWSNMTITKTRKLAKTKKAKTKTLKAPPVARRKPAAPDLPGELLDELAGELAGRGEGANAHHLAVRGNRVV